MEREVNDGRETLTVIYQRRTGDMTAALETGSPPWCARLNAEIDASDRRAIAIAKPLTPQQLNWRRDPAEWSVGQCLDHLCVANDVYIAAIASALTRPPSGAVREIMPGWFGRWFIRSYIEPSSESRRGRAPKKITPSVHVEPGVLDRFLRGNQDARALVRRAADHDVNRVRFRNPFIPVIHFTVGTGLEILVRHQRRHLLQAERICKYGNFPHATWSAG